MRAVAGRGQNQSVGMFAARIITYSGDLVSFREEYRQAINRYGAAIADIGPLVAEAALAFRLNIALSETVMQCVRFGAVRKGSIRG